MWLSQICHIFHARHTVTALAKKSAAIQTLRDEEGIKMETVEEEDFHDGVDQESKGQGDVEGVLADPDYFFNL